MGVSWFRAHAFVNSTLQYQHLHKSLPDRPMLMNLLQIEFDSQRIPLVFFVF